jgi:hypothetical protein
MITSAVLRIEEFRGQSRASIIALVFPVQSLSRASKLLLLSCCCYSSGSWLVGRARRLGGGEPTSRACRHTWTHRAAPFHCQWHVMSRPFHLPRHEAPDGSATEPRARAPPPSRYNFSLTLSLSLRQSATRPTITSGEPPL